MTNWEALLYERDEVEVLTTIYKAINEGDVSDGLLGIEELILQMSNSQDHQLESRLIILMMHILKWKTQQPTRSWYKTIRTQRRAIERLLAKAPRFTKARLLEDFWPKALEYAIIEATDEMDQSPAVTQLSWEDVFAVDYQLNT
jgi:Domain of unknown function DUF29